MEVADLLRKKRLAQSAIRGAVERALKDFNNQTGYLIQSVRVDVEHQMVFGQAAPAHTNVVVRCGVDWEGNEAGKDSMIERATSGTEKEN